MKNVQEVLSDKELAILKGMVGLELHHIMSPTISTDMGSSNYTLERSASFSFNLLQRKSYVVFTNHFKETYLGEDYWKLGIEENIHPKNIGHEKNEYGYELVGNMGMISIWSTIERIVVYSIDLADSEEQLEYDAVLVFRFENGQKVGMTHSVFLIEVSSDPVQIEKMIEPCFEKYCLQ